MAITKINEQTKAPALRNKVNEIVDALNSGGGSSGGGGSISSIQRTVSMAMQGGRLVSGVTEGMLAASDTAKFFNNMHTVLMLGIEFCTVSNIALESGEALTISYYDGNGGFLGTTTTMSNVPSNACYVRFMLGKSSAYTGERVLQVTVLGKPMFQKSSAPSTDLTYRHFAFDTVKTHAAEPDGTIEENAATDSAQKTRTGSYLGDSSRVFDCGWIMFPPNYTPDGEPVPLAVYCHGTSGWSGGMTTNASSQIADYLYADGVRFLCNNGYAVADCSGLTSADNPNDSNCSLGIPSQKTSIVNMVKYLTANYNLCDDGIYIYGKSAGGFITHSLAYMQPIKIKAAGAMNPSICLLLSQRNHVTQKLACVKNTAMQIGTPEITFTEWGDAAKQYYIDNITRWRQIDAFFQGTDLTDEQVAQIVSACYDAETIHMKDVTIADQLTNAAKRFISCPTLIFSDPADTSVSHNTILKYTQMAQRCGSPVFLRTLPAVSGRHHSTDTATEAIKTTYKTKYGGDVEIPVAYAELVDWFNRW